MNCPGGQVSFPRTLFTALQLRVFALTLAAMLVVLCVTPARALDDTRGITQYAHRIWQISQGLPEATIYCINQSHDGYLWLGTLTGLVRFDGAKFARISENGPACVGNIPVVQIVEDTDGTLWLATDGRGVLHLRGETVIDHYGQPEGLPSDRVNALQMDRGKRLWIATTRGMATLAAGHIHALDTRGDFRDLCDDEEGGIYAAGEAAAITHFGQGDAKLMQLKSIPESATIQALYFHDGTLWVASSVGLAAVRNGKEYLITHTDGLADDFVVALSAAGNTILAGTRDGFSRIGARAVSAESRIPWTVESFRGRDGLSQSTVYDVMQDAEGSLWVATKHGLNQFFDGRTIPLTTREGLASNNTGPIVQDASGVIWIGTLDAGLMRHDAAGFSQLAADSGLPSTRVVSLARAKGGGIWAGTDHGLASVNDGHVGKVYHVADGLPSDSITCLLTDARDDVWVGTTAGLARMRGDQLEPAPVSKGAAAALHEGIAALVEKPDGTIIAATHVGGILAIKDGVATALCPAGAAGRNINALYQSADDKLWIGTSGSGLAIIDDGQHVQRYSMHDGLFDDDLFDIVPDDQGRVWFACSKGLFSINASDPAQYAAGKIPRLSSMPMSPTDGLRTIECRPGVWPSAARMADGRLWFGTTQGLVILDPTHLPRHLSAPPVAIEHVTIDGRDEEAQALALLAPGQKNVDFHYTALSFIAPQRIIFRYMLEGYDKHWVEAGGRREAQYTNLPPGSYTFRVEALNPDNTWTDPDVKQALVGFALPPMWYQHRWFIPACVAALLLAVGGGFGLRLNVLRRRMALVVAERGRIARELHDTLLQGLSGVTMEMQALSVQLPPSDHRRTLDEIILDATQCLREARRSIAGLREPRPAAAGLPQLLRSAARDMTLSSDVRVHVEAPEKMRRLEANVEYSLMRIAREAITNALKHSQAANLEVTLKPDGEIGVLTVQDDGIGFATNHDVEGHYGIVGMRERALEIGAVLTMTSSPGHGTAVRVQFPMNSPDRASAAVHAGRSQTLSAGDPQ